MSLDRWINLRCLNSLVQNDFHIAKCRMVCLSHKKAGMKFRLEYPWQSQFPNEVRELFHIFLNARHEWNFKTIVQDVKLIKWEARTGKK